MSENVVLNLVKELNKYIPQVEIGKICGVRQYVVCNWVHNKTKPRNNVNVEMIQKLSQALTDIKQALGAAGMEDSHE